MRPSLGKIVCVAYFPKCTESMCFVMSARRVKVLSHHQAQQAKRFVPFGRDEERSEEAFDLELGLAAGIVSMQGGSEVRGMGCLRNASGKGRKRGKEREREELGHVWPQEFSAPLYSASYRPDLQVMDPRSSTRRRTPTSLQ